MSAKLGAAYLQKSIVAIQDKESPSSSLHIAHNLLPVNELSLKVTAMTSPSAVQAIIGDAMATATIDDSLNSNVQHTAVAQAGDTTTTAEPGPFGEEERQADVKDEPTSGESLEGGQVQEGSHDQIPAVSQPPALSQPDNGLGVGFSMTGGMSLDMLAAFANPMGQMNMFQDPMNPLGYYPPNTMPGMLAMPMAMDDPLIQAPYVGPSSYLEEPEETRISAYAKLIFEDGHFYMNTYSVILGRDIAAWRAAMRAEKKRQEEEADALRTPARVKHEESRYTKSIVSESGGILRHGDDSDPEERARRRKLRKASRASKKSKSDGSSSARPSRRNSAAQASTWKMYQPQQLQSKVERDPAPVNPATFRPSPYDCPLVAIHPPATAPISAYKSISREHVKIAYNSKKSVFEAIILGRNGCFIEDQWYHPNDVVPLESGHSLQIGGITVKFMLPNQLDSKVTEQHEDYEDEPIMDRYSEGGKEMSLEFTDERREGVLRDTSEEDYEAEDNRSIGDEQNSDEMDEDELDEDERDMDEEEPDMRENSELVEDDEEEPTPVKQEQPQVSPAIEKKRGPGRPPKNGIMSKREQKQAKKEEQARLEELAKKPKAQAAQKSVQKSIEKPIAQPQPGAPTKNKVGRPRKHPLPEIPEGPPREKRKYTKRKPKEPKEPKEGEGKGSGSGSEGGGKPKKEKVPPRPPRSPSPVMKEEDYTPEQLAKPQANYVILIHEALTNAPKQQLGLPDIYRAIYRRYPYFKLKTQTLGWQSSVRHNLSQHPSFRKVEKDGKGWTWGIVDGISIEKEKKKRVTPPPPQHHGQMPHQPLYPGYPHIMGYGPPPPGYMMPPNMPPGQHPQYMMPPHIAGYPPPMPPHMNGNLPPNGYSHMAGPPPSFAAKIPPQLAAPNVQTSYSSPYAAKPAEQASPPAQSAEQPPAVESLVPASTPENPPLDAQSQPPAPQPPIPQQPQTQHLNSQPPSLQSTQQQPVATPSVSATASPIAPPPPLTTTASPLAPPNLQPQQQTQMKMEIPPAQAQSHTQDPISTQQPSPPKRASPNPSSSETDAVQETVMQAAQSFGKTIIEGMKVQTPNAEAIVNSAINQVLKITTESAVPGNNIEEVIMKALRGLLSNIPGSGIEPDSPSTGKPFLTTVEAYQAQASRPSPNHIRPHVFQQHGKSGSSEKSVPAVARPSFHAQGQNRQNGTPVPRPPIMPSGQKRTNSEGPVHAPSRPNAPSASPAPTPSTVDGASAAKVPASEIGQIAGQKRPHDDSDDMREFKRIPTSGPPQLKT